MSASPLEAFKGKNNVLVLFAPSKTDAGYTTQTSELDRHDADWRRRDVVRVEVVTDDHAVVDGQPQPAISAIDWQNAIGVDAGFMLALIGKDGTIKLKSTDVLPARELMQVIDSIPNSTGMIREGL